MQAWQYIVFTVAVLFAGSLVLHVEAQADSNSLAQLYSESETDPYVELAWEILRRGQVPMFRGRIDGQAKRGGPDLGIGRGYSGSLTAKHLMGLASANYAGGPGRRKRESPSA